MTLQERPKGPPLPPKKLIARKSIYTDTITKMPITKIDGPRAASMLQDPTQFVEEYYRKGLRNCKTSKDFTVLCERDDDGKAAPLLLEVANAVFETEFKDNLPKYRKLMLKAKAQRKATVIMMPLWFVMSPIPSVEEQQTWVNRFDEEGDLHQLAKETGFLATASIFHTGDVPNPVLLCAVLVPDM